MSRGFVVLVPNLEPCWNLPHVSVTTRRKGGSRVWGSWDWGHPYPSSWEWAKEGNTRMPLALATCSNHIYTNTDSGWPGLLQPEVSQQVRIPQRAYWPLVFFPFLLFYPQATSQSECKGENMKEINEGAAKRNGFSWHDSNHDRNQKLQNSVIPGISSIEKQIHSIVWESTKS